MDIKRADVYGGRVIAEIELDHAPAYLLKVELVSDVIGRRQLNSNCNVWGVMQVIAEAVEEAGEKSYTGDRLTFVVTFEQGARADTSM